MNWLLRLDQAQSDATLREAHTAWLARDPQNALAWQQACKGWKIIDKIEPTTRSDWPRHPAVGLVPSKVAAQAGRRRRSAAWVAIAAAACLIVAALPALHRRLGADYATATAETQAISLRDGSTVRLAPESAFSADLESSERRTIRMSNGRAFFEVARDALRPFVVQAGDVSITVLGTAFDVRVSDDVVAVAVRHGRVAVRQSRDRIDTQLSPGDQVTIHRGTGQMIAETVPDAAIGSWAEGQLSVLNTSVAEVVSEIRRYHRGWIIIADDGLASERVTGLYNLQKPEMALAALVQPVGGHIRQLSPFLTILSKSAK